MHIALKIRLYIPRSVCVQTVSACELHFPLQCQDVDCCVCDKMRWNNYGVGASQQARDRQTEGEVWGSTDVCGFSYLSGKAPALIVTGLSTASAPDKEGIEGTGKGKPTGCPDISAENSNICEHSVYAPLC